MPAKGHGKTVTQGEIAEIIGVTAATIRAWQRAGCPVEQKGGSGRPSLYNSAHVIGWRMAMVLGDTADLPLDEARRRKLAAEAQLAEMELELKRGEMTPTRPMLRHIEEAFNNYRKELLALPARYGAQIAAEAGCDVAKIDRALTATIRDHLGRLSAPVVRG
jgi:terminase small subunit / prophage DNA-packing protein